MSYSNIRAENGSIYNIDICTCEERWFNESSTVYIDCVDIVAIIGSVTFKQCPREANQVAHELARIFSIDKILITWSTSPLVIFYTNV